MTTDYSDVLDILSENGLSFTDVDRIEIRQETYDLWQNRMESARTSDHETIEGPAIRVTEGDEKVVHVDEQGREVEYVL